MRKEILLLKGTAAILRGEADPTADGSGNGTSLPGAGFNAFFLGSTPETLNRRPGRLPRGARTWGRPEGGVALR